MAKPTEPTEQQLKAVEYLIAVSKEPGLAQAWRDHDLDAIKESMRSGRFRLSAETIDILLSGDPKRIAEFLGEALRGPICVVVR